MSDHVISNNLVVLGMSSFTGGMTFDGQVILDLDNTEALLVRKDGDGGDVFIVDTVNSLVQLPGSVALEIGTTPAAAGSIRLSNAASIVIRNANDNGDITILVSPQSDEFDLFNNTVPRITLKNAVTTFEQRIFVQQVGTSTASLTVGATMLVDTTNAIIRVGATAGATIRGSNAAAFACINQAASSTVPTLIPRRDSLTTGIGAAAAGRLSFINLGVETVKIIDGGRFAINLPEQVSIGSPTFIDNVQVNITGSFIDDYGGGPTETHKVKIQGGQTGDTGRTNRQTSVDVDTFIITQNLSQTINEVGAVFIDAPALTIGTDTVNIGYTLKVNNYPTDGTENYGLLVDGASATANLTALVRFGKSGLQTGIKLLVGGSVGFDDLDANAQMRLTGIYTSDGAATSAALLHVHTTLLPEDGTTDHITGAFFQGTLRTQVAADENVANISQVRIDEPNIQDNLTGTGEITNAQSLLITGAPTEGESNFTLRSTGAAPSIFAGLQFIIGDTLVDDWKQVFISGTFVSGGGAAEAAKFQVEAVLEGAAGDTTFLVGANFSSAVRTQTATEDVTDIAQVRMNAITIFDNLTGSITNAQTLLITGAPTAGVNNYALRIGGGDLQIAASSAFLFRNNGDSGDLTALSNAPTDFLEIGGVGAGEWERVNIYSLGSIRILPTDELNVRTDNSSAFRVSTAGNVTLFQVQQTQTRVVGSLVVADSIANNSAETEIQSTFADVATSAGSSVFVAGLIPAGSFVIGVTVRVLTTVLGPASFDVGDGTDVDRWGASIGISVATTTDITDFTTGALTNFPFANDVRLTSTGVDFTGGSVRITVHYMTLQTSAA
jgi:hypothetical protein